MPHWTLVIHLMTDHPAPHDHTAKPTGTLTHTPSLAITTWKAALSPCLPPPHPPSHPHTFPLAWGSWWEGGGWGGAGPEGPQRQPGQGAEGGWESPGCLSWEAVSGVVGRSQGWGEEGRGPSTAAVPSPAACLGAERPLCSPPLKGKRNTYAWQISPKMYFSKTPNCLTRPAAAGKFQGDGEGAALG